jgi:hypothetical protein
MKLEFRPRLRLACHDALESLQPLCGCALNSDIPLTMTVSPGAYVRNGFVQTSNFFLLKDRDQFIKYPWNAYFRSYTHCTDRKSMFHADESNGCSGRQRTRKALDYPALSLGGRIHYVKA